MNTRMDWKKLLLEMLVIVFSVLFALLLDDVRQSRNERELTNSVLVSLRVELERNQDLLESRLPLHESIHDSLAVQMADYLDASAGDVRALEGMERVSSLEELGFADRLAPVAAFSRSGWEVGLASDAITRIATDQLFLFSTGYAIQADLTRLSDRLLRAYDQYNLALVENQSPGFALLTLTSALSTLVDTEQNLCDTYRILSGQLYGVDRQDSGRCGSGSIRVR